MLLLQGKKKELRPLLFPNRGPNTVGLLGTATRIKSQPPRHLTPPQHTQTYTCTRSYLQQLASPQAPFPTPGVPIFPKLFLHGHPIDLFHVSLQDTSPEMGGGRHEELEARAPTCLTVSDTATQSHCVPGGPRLSPLELPHQEFAASSKHIPDLAQRTTPLQGPTAILAESDGQQKLRGAHADWLLSLLLPSILHTSRLPQKPSD